MVATTVEQTRTRPGMTLEAYLSRSGERFEIINGREVPMSPTGYLHDSLKENLSEALKVYVKAHQLGRVMTEYTFLDPDNVSSNWVTGSFVPDIAFVAGARVDDYLANPVIDVKLPLALIPDLIIEIRSPTDRNLDVLGKIGYLLDLGVKAIWLINQRQESVTLYTPDSEPYTLTGDDLLTTDLLPGWSIAIHDLFANEFGA